MKKIILILAALFSANFVTDFAVAGTAVSPLAVSIVPPVEFPPSDYTITGLRVSALWGHHRDLYGIDLGLLGNMTDQTFTGAAVSGVFNMTHGSTTILGLQVAGGANINTSKADIYGLQLAIGFNQNTAESTIVGLQIAAANLSEFTNLYGVQLGIYNRVKDVYGLQIGIVNVADSLHGVQIGLVNFNHKGPFGVSPILNVGF